MPIGPPPKARRRPPPERRSSAHKQWIRTLPCVCARKSPGFCEGPKQAAHFRMATGGGMGLKPHDMWTFPACAEHHRIQHAIGEPEFQRRYGLSLRAICMEYAARSVDRRIRERAAIELAREAA